MRHLLSYVLFVGVPLAGLVGVLRLGQGLDAPRAVHGAWTVQPMAASGRLCAGYLLSGDSSLVVTQSGRQLSASLGPEKDVTLRGRLTGDELTLEGVVQPGATRRHVGCGPGDTLRLAGRVFRNDRLARLDARLWSSACRECGPVGFTAVGPPGRRGRARA